MLDKFIYILAATGAVALLLFVGMVLTAIGCAIIDFLRDLRYAYQWKHRYDRKPISKCYCRDCYYRSESLCLKWGKCTYDEWHCFHAYPRQHDYKDKGANECQMKNDEN